MKKSIEDYPLAELKGIYRALHAQLPQHPDLMDSELLHDLQQFLQQKARAAGVDVTLHAHWATWLDR